MAVLKHTDTLNNLKRKGFKEVTRKSGDHIRIEFWYDNKLTRANTKFSHNKQDLNNSLISLMSKQVCLTKSKFIALAKCPLSQAEYESILREQNYI